MSTRHIGLRATPTITPPMDAPPAEPSSSATCTRGAKRPADYDCRGGAKNEPRPAQKETPKAPADRYEPPVSRNDCVTGGRWPK